MPRIGIKRHLRPISAASRGVPRHRLLLPIRFRSPPSFCTSLGLAECAELLLDDSSTVCSFKRTSFILFVGWLLLLGFLYAWCFHWWFDDLCSRVEQGRAWVSEVDVDQFQLRSRWPHVLVEILDNAWLEPEGWVRCWMHAAVGLSAEWLSCLALVSGSDASLCFRLIVWSPAHLIRVGVEVRWHRQIQTSLVWIKHINLCHVNLLAIYWVHEEMSHSGVVESWRTVPQALILCLCMLESRHRTLAVMIRARNHHWRSKITIFLLYRELLWFWRSFNWHKACLSRRDGLSVFQQSFNRHVGCLRRSRNTFWLVVFVGIVRCFLLRTKSSPELFHHVVFFSRTGWLSTYFESCLFIFCKHWTRYRNLVLIGFVECGALLVSCIYRCIMIWTHTLYMVMLLNFQLFFNVVLIWIFNHLW